MRIVLASMLALGLGSALPAFAVSGTTPGLTSPVAHSAPKHNHTHATKHHKQAHNGNKREGK